jgi:branched-chain amino acid transport system substrate-binding protein
MKRIAFIMAVCFIFAPVAIAASADPIPIAVIAVQSGPSEPLGEQEFLGARTAVEEINKAGGVLGGRMLKLLEYDEGYSGEVSQTSFAKAQAAGVKFVIGPHEASAAYAVIPKAKEAKVIYWDCIAATDAATVPGYYRGLFNSPTQAKQAVIAFNKWLDKKGYKSIARIPASMDYCKQSVAWTDLYVEQHPNAHKVASTVWYEWGKTDVTAQMVKLVAAKPDFIWLYVWSGSQAFPAVTRLRELGFKGGIAVDWASLDDGQMAREGGANMEGVYSFTGWLPDPKVSQAMEFANKFWDYCKRNNLKRDPGDYAVSAYIGVHAFAKAVTKAGTADNVDAIIDGIYSLTKEPWITPRGVQFEMLPGGLEYSPGEYIQVIKNGKVEIADYSLLTREDFGPPYAAPGYKTLLELEKEASGKK